MSAEQNPEVMAKTIAACIGRIHTAQARRLIAIAGPPASGKSTMAEALKAELNATAPIAEILAMDGFHLDNGLLDARGMRDRKGSPDTFDLPGFSSLLHRLRTEPDLYGPAFDRARDVSVGSSVHFPSTITTVIVEGNYLLLDMPGWRDLAALWDLSVRIDVDTPVLHQRLLDRWKGYGFSSEQAQAKVDHNDMPNVALVSDHPITPHMTLTVTRP